MKKKPIKRELNVLSSDLYTLPKISIYDGTYIQIENCEKITNYDKNIIEILVKKVLVTITGNNLILKTLSKSMIAITGEIEQISFLRGDM